MKVLVGLFIQEKALVGAISVKSSRTFVCSSSGHNRLGDDANDALMAGAGRVLVMAVAVTMARARACSLSAH